MVLPITCEVCHKPTGLQEAHVLLAVRQWFLLDIPPPIQVEDNSQHFCIMLYVMPMC